MGIIPSFLDDGSTEHYDGGAFSNVRLRLGEVQEKILPTSPRSLSKRVIEYSVLVNHLDNGTQVQKMYDYCTVSNLFGSIADNFTHTLRESNTATVSRSNKRPSAGAGTGAKVLLLCVNGSHHSAVIIGGIPDAETPREADLGHNLHFVFNGVDVEINDAGEMTLAVHGKTNNEGVTAEEVGTSVKLSKDGNVAVTTKDCSIVIDQVAGKVNVTAKNDVVVASPKIHLGSAGADEPAVLGNKWLDGMHKLLQAIQKMTVYTPVGPSSIPINVAEFKAIEAQLAQQLSDTVFED